MRKKVLFFLLIIPLGCGQKIDEKSELEAMQKMMVQSQVDWNRGDIRAFMNSYLNDSNLQFITRRGIVKGWQSTLEKYLKSYPTKDSMGRLQFDLEKVELIEPISSGLGHITGRWKLYRFADTPHGYFSLITKKTESGPKIIIDHTW